MSVIFGVAVLITGAIWAKASWGNWWVWDEPTLVSFLIVFLLYVTYYPLRYAIEDRERQARYASVFAITAGAFVPINFIAVRLAESLVHPRVFATAEATCRARCWLTFLVCARRRSALLWTTLVKLELTAKNASGQLKRLRRALERRPGPGGAARDRPGEAGGSTMPALPLDEAGKYVAGAYVVFVVLILVYVAIMAAKLQRIERELRELAGFAETRSNGEGASARARGGERLMSEILALGVSHKTAPLELRERLALPEGRAVGVLSELTATEQHPRGGGDLDLQPHRALPGRLRSGRGRVDGARRARPPGGDPADRAGRPPLLAARRARPRGTSSASPRGSTR